MTIWGNQLSEFFEACLDAARSGLEVLDEEKVLSANPAALVADAMRQTMPTQVAIDWTALTHGKIVDTTVPVQDAFGDATTAPASEVTITVPVTGTAKMLTYHASTFTLGDLGEKIGSHSLTLKMVARDFTVDALLSTISKFRTTMDQRVTWANDDLTAFLPFAQAQLTSFVASRRDRITHNRAVAAALDAALNTEEN